MSISSFKSSCTCGTLLSHATTFSGARSVFFQKSHNIRCSAYEHSKALDISTERASEKTQLRRHTLRVIGPVVVDGCSEEWCRKVSGHIIKRLLHVDPTRVLDTSAFAVHHLLLPTNSLITQWKRLIQEAPQLTINSKAARGLSAGGGGLHGRHFEARELSDLIYS